MMEAIFLGEIWLVLQEGDLAKLGAQFSDRQREGDTAGSWGRPPSCHQAFPRRTVVGCQQRYWATSWWQRTRGREWGGRFVSKANHPSALSSFVSLMVLRPCFNCIGQTNRKPPLYLILTRPDPALTWGQLVPSWRLKCDNNLAILGAGGWRVPCDHRAGTMALLRIKWLENHWVGCEWNWISGFWR